MNPNGVGLLVVLALATVAAAVLAGWAWDKPRRWETPIRVGLLALCALTAISTAAVAVNREMSMYTRWAQFAGDEKTEPPPVDRLSARGSRLVVFKVPGPKSGISMPAYVYLPPGYSSSGLRYPVIEAFAGFPGSPQAWFNNVSIQSVLDDEISSNRMAPTVVVFPVQHPSRTRNSECVDAVGGARFDTYLTVDVPAEVRKRFRVRTERSAWGMMGFSTGGFCAVNLLLRHPDRYAAAAAVAGHLTPVVDGNTGDLYRGNAQVRRENDPQWRIRNLAVPPVAVYLGTAADDKEPFEALRSFVEAAKPPMRVETRTIPSGGHSMELWRAFTPPVLDWLSANLAAPTSHPL